MRRTTGEGSEALLGLIDPVAVMVIARVVGSGAEDAHAATARIAAAAAPRHRYRIATPARAGAVRFSAEVILSETAHAVWTAGFA